MEASAPLPAEPGPSGELVQLTGQDSGTHHPLVCPLTLVGQSSGCQIHLNGEGVAPLHCAIVPSPAGPVVRDLDSPGGTLINDERVTSKVLVSGDVLEVGPLRFRVELPAPGTAEAIPVSLASEDGEREAVRIQVAAVAAQQVALGEEEARLAQRATALERQHEQLASHLEERRGKLEELREQVRVQRQEAEAVTAEASADRNAASRERVEAARLHEEAARERKRLSELRRRLRRRWKKHFAGREADLGRRETDLQHQAAELQRKQEKLQQTRLRYNTESELGRRHLREEWRELALAQQRGEEGLEQEHQDRERRLRDLAERQRQVEAGESALAREQQQWAVHLARLQKESAGLETRIHNQRAQIAPAGPVSAHVLPVGPIIPPAPVADGSTAHAAVLPGALHNLARQLADQRSHLAQQWQQLLEVHVRWQGEHAQAMLDFEEAARLLEEREGRAREREALVAEREELARERLEGVARRASSLEGWQARLTVQTASWEAERAALLGEARRAAVEQDVRAERLEEVHARRNRRRRQELAALQLHMTRCEEARQAYVALWQEYQQRRETVEQEARKLAARALAVERYRLELLERSPRAEQRIDKLNRRETARLAELAREVDEQRQALTGESARVEEWALAVKAVETQVLAAREEVRGQQEEVEARVEELAQREDGWQQDLARMRQRHEQQARLIAGLREEIERLARALMEETPPVEEAPAKAA